MLDKNGIAIRIAKELKDGYYVNLLGMVQKGRFVSKPPGLGREDWKIIAYLLLNIVSNDFKVNLPGVVSVINSYMINKNLKSKFIMNRLFNYTPFIEYKSVYTTFLCFVICIFSQCSSEKKEEPKVMITTK